MRQLMSALALIMPISHTAGKRKRFQKPGDGFQWVMQQTANQNRAMRRK